MKKQVLWVVEVKDGKNWRPIWNDVNPSYSKEGAERNISEWVDGSQHLVGNYRTKAYLRINKS